MTDRTLVNLRAERVRRNLDALAAELQGNPALTERTLTYLDNGPGEIPGEHKGEDAMADKAKDTDRELLTAEQVAEYLSWTLRYVYAHRKKGLPLFRVGRQWRCFKTDLVAWLQKQKEASEQGGQR